MASRKAFPKVMTVKADMKQDAKMLKSSKGKGAPKKGKKTGY